MGHGVLNGNRLDFQHCYGVITGIIIINYISRCNQKPLRGNAVIAVYQG